MIRLKLSIFLPSIFSLRHLKHVIFRADSESERESGKANTVNFHTANAYKQFLICSQQIKAQRIQLVGQPNGQGKSGQKEGRSRKEQIQREGEREKRRGEWLLASLSSKCFPAALRLLLRLLLLLGQHNLPWPNAIYELATPLEMGVARGSCSWRNP